jgi:hypothetical protein
MASGSVDFPTYMKEVHEDWLRNTADAVSSSVTDLINAVLTSSPYDGQEVYDPTTKIDNMYDAVDDFDARVDALNPTTDWTGAVNSSEAAVNGIVDSSYFEDFAEEVYNYMEDQLNDSILPTFRGGMRDVNAAISSAFVMGEAKIRAFAMRDANKIVGDLKAKYELAKLDLVFKGADRIVQSTMAQVEYEKAVTHYSIEAERLGIAARKDQADGNLGIIVGRAKFDFDAFQYGANILASVSGGTAYTNGDTPSQTQSSLAGALAGAAIGSQISGNWQGGAIGGALGLGLSLLS